MNLQFIIDNILRNPPILLGGVAMLGLVLQKKKIDDIIKGSLLAALGMFILQQGVGVLVGAIAPVNTTIQIALGAVVESGFNDQTFTTNYGGMIGIAMLLGFILHILIARFTPLKNIFLTGHFLWWIPFIFTAVGVENNFYGAKLILFSAILSAIYWSVIPYLLKPFVQDVTESDSFTLGHPAGILALVAGIVSKYVGDKSKSTEDIKIPKSLSFFREIAITGGIVIFIMFVVLGIIFKDSLQTNGQGIVFYAANQGLMFGAGLTIMLSGVRMIINQLLPAFQGIALKLVPNAIPALDCPIIFNYKPNAVLIGFIVAMLSSTFFIIIAAKLNLFSVILIPLIITSFFECGTAAVIAEGQGGLRGTIVGTLVASLVMVVILGVSVGVFSKTIFNWILIFGGNDLSLWGIIANGIANLI
ncbi:PTS ascorbate transporter subunit IIC [Fusobacterium mortiferum]|jgi:phosphotransferase system|uniref:PTS ascorbate transporter subunit IIC n=1 Tax=Fusobacterium mortiferum TaxID=850 RepID=UPI00158EDB91|nr:PTS ascorbate transporter subunit IIC [Fusobacterium mortiferum]